MNRLDRKYITQKNLVIKFLKNKGQYEEVDLTLLNEFAFNNYLMDVAKDDIQKRGITINVTKNPDKDDYFLPNPSVTTYNNALKNVNAILTKLGITPAERVKLKLQNPTKNKKKSGLGT